MKFTKLFCVAIASLTTASSFAAPVDCTQLAKTVIGTMASGSLPVRGRYAVRIYSTKAATIQTKDEMGYVETVNATLMTALVSSGSYSTTYQVWAAPQYRDVNGCSILKIKMGGVQ